MRYALEIEIDSYIGQPYWPEMDRLVTIVKESGMNRARSSANRRAALRMEKARALSMLGPGHDGEAVAELRAAERLSPAQVHNHPMIRDQVAHMLRRASGSELQGLAWRMGVRPA